MVIWNDDYSIYTDFNTKDVKIFNEDKQNFIQVPFDTVDEAKEWLEGKVGKMDWTTG